MVEKKRRKKSIEFLYHAATFFQFLKQMLRQMVVN